MIMAWPVPFVDGPGSRPIRGQIWNPTTNKLVQEKITLYITNDITVAFLSEKRHTREEWVIKFLNCL